MTRVLLVDDTRVSREIMKVYLMGADMQFLDAGDGEEALQVIRRERPDLVLADMRMPRLDGPGLCEALRMDMALKHIPVIILTGEKDAESRRRCLQSGALDVLTKPVQPKDLLECIYRHLPRSSNESVSKRGTGQRLKITSPE